MRFLIFSCLILVFFSCQKEDIYLNDVIIDEKISTPLYNPIEEALQLVQRHNANLSSNSLNSADSILEGKIFLLTDTFYHVRDSITQHNSYTFSFYRIGVDSLQENLVLQQQVDGSYKPYYVSYDLQLNMSNDINHFIFNNVEEIMSFHSGAFNHLLSQVESRCIRIPIVLCVERCPCQDHCPMQGCKCHTKPKGVISFILDCDLSNPFGGGGGGSGTDVPSFTITPNIGGAGLGGGTGGSGGDIPGGVLDSTSSGGGTPSSNLGGGITTPNLDIGRERIIHNAMLWFDERGITYPSNPWFGENLDRVLQIQSFHSEREGEDGITLFTEALVELLTRHPDIEIDKSYQVYDYVNLNAGINIQSFLNTYQVERFLAVSTMYQHYEEQIGDPPSDEYQWQLMMEVFYEELLPVLAEFTPGIGDLIGAYNDFQNGDYFWACFGIISAVIPGDELIKVFRRADNIRDGWKAVKTVRRLWDKLMTSSGGRKILNEMPQSWKNLSGSKLADNQKGLKWTKDAFHELRIMDANPSTGHPWHQHKYVRMKKNGNFLGKDGIYYQKGTIPNEDFQNLTHIPIDQVTETWIADFFN